MHENRWIMKIVMQTFFPSFFRELYYTLLCNVLEKRIMRQDGGIRWLFFQGPPFSKFFSKEPSWPSLCNSFFFRVLHYTVLCNVFEKCITCQDGGGAWTIRKQTFSLRNFHILDYFLEEPPLTFTVSCRKIMGSSRSLYRHFFFFFCRVLDYISLCNLF